jgi:tetratricopeptide (TPR) repeat protein
MNSPVHRWRVAVGLSALAAATATAYLPALRAGFVWDDDAHVTHNLTLRSAAGLRAIWTGVAQKATSQYYPLTFTAFWVQYRLWGLHPAGYHAVNVALHALNAALLWFVLRGLRVRAAWFAAAAFALHPLHVMSVAWITELKNVLAMSFGLLFVLSYLAFDRRSEGPGPLARRWLFHGSALLCFALALLAKTAAASLAAGLVLALWARDSRLDAGRVAAVIPFLAAGAGMGLLTLWIERWQVGAAGRAFDLALAERVVVAGRAFWFYLGKLVWPHPLMFFYPRWEPAPRFSAFLPAAACALLLAVAWATPRRIGRAPFAALLYFGLASAFLPLAQVLYMMRYTPVSDHWTYFANPAIIALAAGSAGKALNGRGWAVRAAAAAGAVLLLTAYGVLTWRQGFMYRDAETLYIETIRRNPAATIASYNLAVLREQQGRFDEAVELYRQTLASDPRDDDAMVSLGTVYAARGDLASAARLYGQAVAVNSGNYKALMNIGALLAGEGRTEEAIAHYRSAIRLQPQAPEPHHNLAVALAKGDRNAEAVSEFEQAIRLRPDLVEAYLGLSAALVGERRLDNAEHVLRDGLGRVPHSIGLRNNLGGVLILQNRLDDAQEELQRVMEMEPGNADAARHLDEIKRLRNRTVVP